MLLTGSKCNVIANPKANFKRKIIYVQLFENDLRVRQSINGNTYFFLLQSAVEISGNDIIRHTFICTSPISDEFFRTCRSDSSDLT